MWTTFIFFFKWKL